MDWKEKIKQGMKLIKEGCAEQTDWPQCRECPFDEYCTAAIENLGFEIPSEEENF